MSKQILLINLPLPFTRHSPLSEKEDYHEHLGLESLAAVLRARGFSVKLIDAQSQGLRSRELIEEVVSGDYQLVGFSLFHFSINLLGEICQEIKARKKNLHLTCGGHFVTAAYEAILHKFPTLDSIVRGEGELTLTNLADRVLAGEEWRTVPGLAYLQEGEVKLSPGCELISDLDQLPFPARDFLDRELALGKKIDMINIYSSRGCYGTCCFCSIKAFYGRKGKAWRARSAQNVVDELEYLQQKYQPGMFNFVDDNFIGIGSEGKRRAMEIAKEIRRRGLKINFMISCRVDDVEPKLVSLLKSAGLIEVFLGIESFSQAELNFVNKLVSYEENFRAIEILQSMNLNISPGFIMFTPYTKLPDIIRNIKFLQKYNLMDIGKFTFLFRVEGSAFAAGTPGVFKEDYDIFSYSNLYRHAYNFQDAGTAKLVEIMQQDYWDLKAFTILRRYTRISEKAEAKGAKYFLYQKYVDRINQSFLEKNIQYIKDVISIISAVPNAKMEERLQEIRTKWRTDGKQARKLLRELERKVSTEESGQKPLKITLNPDVRVTPTESGLYRYANICRNTYVIVNAESHSIIQSLITERDAHAETKEWQEFVGYLFDRQIVDVAEEDNLLWQAVSAGLKPDERKVVCCDLREEGTLSEEEINELCLQLFLQDVKCLKVISAQLDNEVELIVSKANCVMQEVILQTANPNLEVLLHLAERLDKVILQLSPERLIAEEAVIKQLREKLRWKTPDHFGILLEGFRPEVLPVLESLETNVKVEVLQGQPADVLQSNPRISAVDYQYERLEKSNQGRIYAEKKVM